MMIEARNLTKVYRVYEKEPGFWGSVRGLFKRKFREVAATDSISFSIEEGEIVGFLGPNGAGKTTTLKMLSGLLEPTRGSAQVLGFTPWERKNDFRRQIALLLGQKNQLWWDLPARESLLLNRVIYGLDESEARKTIDELTEYLDVRDKLDVMVRELSLGERMKMELIASLLHRPKVLFLDEPTIGLDVISQKKVRDFLKTYTNQKKITTILTSHYMQDVEELCKRVIIIDHGKLFYDGGWEGIVGRFSNVKIVSLKFTQPPQNVDWTRFGEILESGECEIVLKIAKDQVADLCREAVAIPHLDDLNISTVPVEEIIRKLFQENKAA